MTERDIAILGPYPPTFGGVSVHLYRLMARLAQSELRAHLYNLSTSAEGPDVTAITRGRRRFTARLLARPGARLLHLHHPFHPQQRALVYEAAHRLGRPFVVSLHSPTLMDRAEREGGLFRRMVERMLRYPARLHVVNQDMAVQATRLGVEPERVVHFPAFLPPLRDLSRLRQATPETLDFVRSHSPVIMSVGSFVEPSRGDIYGLWPLARLMDRLRVDFPDVGLVFFLHYGFKQEDPRHREWLEWMEARGLREHVHVVYVEEMCAPLFAEVDLHLRPTTIDGDALTIREAMAFGTPVVASDVVPRPEGTLTFTTSDEDSLLSTTAAALGELEALKARVAALEQPDPFPVILQMYREVLERA